MNFPVSTHPPPPTGRTPALNTWRCFGTQQTDLEVNFRATARPTLVTSLLAASDTAHGDAGSYWLGQTVPHRTLGLLQLVATTESTSVFSIELQCQEARCREPAFEISVPLEALIKRQNDGDARMIEKSRNTTALFRPPTAAVRSA